jgi:putative Mg2+ transporter-C (MgtC) family protein
MENLFLIHPGFWYGVVVAIVCGAIVGYERQLKDKPVGARTSILICLGTQIFVSIGSSFTTPSADPTRVIGQVVTGIGFIGGGVILARRGIVIGVTTAATIWVLAAIGVVIGVGHYLTAIMLSIVTVIILIGFDYLDKRILAGKAGKKSPDDE